MRWFVKGPLGRGPGWQYKPEYWPVYWYLVGVVPDLTSPHGLSRISVVTPSGPTDRLVEPSWSLRKYVGAEQPFIMLSQVREAVCLA